MSSKGTRSRKTVINGVTGYSFPSGPKRPHAILKYGAVGGGTQITESESHRYDRKLGHYVGGGPFYTSRITQFDKPGYVSMAYYPGKNRFYTGPIRCTPPTATEISELGGPSVLSYGSRNEEQMLLDGTNAISYSNPVNPASQLGTTLAEIHREGIPSLPGIQTWENRTKILRAAGSEYLNYEFGWAPLLSEVHSVSKSISKSSFIMNQYRSGEGKDTHREFYFPYSHSYKVLPDKNPSWAMPNGSEFLSSGESFIVTPKRSVSRFQETRKWFKGCFTYAVPSYGRLLGIGSQADQILGISLTPDVLWELTPWSWAIDWFSNAGEVINNITNFGLAGLVMRYGFMMEETIDRYEAQQGNGVCMTSKDNESSFSGPVTPNPYTMSSSGFEIVTKRRVVSSPFGFGIGWEGLSPTQLAITAALGITKLL